jgi:hypothetical protein
MVLAQAKMEKMRIIVDLEYISRRCFGQTGQRQNTEGRNRRKMKHVESSVF